MKVVEIHEGRVISPFSETKLSGKYELSPLRKKRSNPQNSYYWSVLIKEISKETGHSPEDTHAKLAYKFLIVRTESQPFVRSTTSLNTAEMEEYSENIRKWASEFLNLYLPLPGEWSE